MFDYYNILGWDSFSKNYFEYVKNNILQKISIKTHHDLACGSGYFVNRMNNYGIISKGSNISYEQIDIAKTRYIIDNYTISDMTNFILDEKVDFITCNNDAINHLYSINEWEEVFINVYKNLNNKGYFLFDYHTLIKINKTKYNKEIYNMGDFVIENIEESIGNNFYRSIGKIYNKDKLSLLRYLKSYHTSFEDNLIIEKLLKVGFKKYKLLNLSNHDRKYILAFKY